MCLGGAKWKEYDTITGDLNRIIHRAAKMYFANSVRIFIHKKINLIRKFLKITMLQRWKYQKSQNALFLYVRLSP